MICFFPLPNLFLTGLLKTHPLEVRCSCLFLNRMKSSGKCLISSDKYAFSSQTAAWLELMRQQMTIPLGIRLPTHRGRTVPMASVRNVLFCLVLAALPLKAIPLSEVQSVTHFSYQSSDGSSSDPLHVTALSQELAADGHP